MSSLAADGQPLTYQVASGLPAAGPGDLIIALTGRHKSCQLRSGVVLTREASIVPAALRENVLTELAQREITYQIFSSVPTTFQRKMNPRQALEWNLDALKRILGVKRKLIDVRVDYGILGVRQALCEVTNAIEPEFGGWTPATVELTVELTNPAGFWQDVDMRYWNWTGGPNNWISVDAFAGGTAPMTDLQYLVRGPATNPGILDSLTGHYIQYMGTLAAGQNWKIYAGEMKMEIGYGLDFTNTGIRQVANITRAGPHLPALMTLTTPQNGAAPVIGLWNAQSLEIYGRRKYL